MLTAPTGSGSLVPEQGADIIPEPDSTGSLDDVPDSLPLITLRPFRRSSHPVESTKTGSAMDRRSSDTTSSAPAPIVHFNADWSHEASPVSHIFVPTSSGESCYLTPECRRSGGSRSKCVSCRVTVHESCLESLNSKFPCRQTFRQCIRKYREQTSVDHHWVQRKNLKGKCKACCKAFNGKLGFSSSSGVAGYSCSWCKYSYHSKEGCMAVMDNDTDCDLGSHSSIIVPPSWVVKVPRKESFKSSLKNSPKKTNSKLNLMDQKVKEEGEKKDKLFCIKPIPSPDISPLLIFLNPKSGGNQGAKLMQKFQWLLNPRQVFDLTQGGPGPAIDMFRRVPNCKLLACGGDGTVGWLLSVLDKIQVDYEAAVGVLPLGTGNDLSRSLGWGGGYIDEPISKIIGALATATEVRMDRWQLNVTRNEDHPATEEKGEDKLPLNVVNNYFSFGVDAQIALEFHEAREANPAKFNSRIRNKMYYGQAGGKDLLLRKWKDLSDEVTVECDGVDITPKLKEHRVHSVLFANIPSFGSGTRPWNRAHGEQKIDDGLIEVMGLTTYTLPLLQAGGHGTFLAQCKSAKIVTKKTIPMQVDGEASRLNPAIIELEFLNQVTMLAKIKGAKRGGSGSNGSSSSVELPIFLLSMNHYEAYYADKAKLKELSASAGAVNVGNFEDLEQVRGLISSNCKSLGDQEWCYVDSVTAVRFFRIDRAQENLHYVSDICADDGLYILQTSPSAMNGDIRRNGPPVNIVEPEDADDEDEGLPISRSKSKGGCTPKVSPKVNPKNEAPLLEKTTEGVLKAARLGDIKMLTDLFNENYSMLSIDETGKTALHYGARFGHKEIIKFLISKAPSSILDMIDNEKGQTALHKAAGYKRRTICCMLVAAGSSLSIQDQAGQTPRQLADKAEDHDLSSYLESQEHFQNERDGRDFETPV